MCLRSVCDQAVSMSGWCAESNASFSDACGDQLFTRNEQLVRFVLKFLQRDFSAGMGLQLCVELIVLLQTGFEGRVCQNTGTEFLKMHTDLIEGKVASAVGTFNSRQCYT